VSGALVVPGLILTGCPENTANPGPEPETGKSSSAEVKTEDDGPPGGLHVNPGPDELEPEPEPDHPTNPGPVDDDAAEPEDS
jgi:hypothetical protein